MLVQTLLSVIPGPVYGGAHNQAARLAPGLSRAGWRTVVALPDGHDADAAHMRLASGGDGVTVVRLPMARVRAVGSVRQRAEFFPALPRDVRRLRGIIRSVGADVVQVHGPTNPQAAFAAQLEGVGVVWQVLDTRAPAWVCRAASPVMRHLSDVVMSTGTRVLDEYSLTGRRSAGPPVVPFYPPVDPTEFAPAAPHRRAAARDALGVGPDDFVVGTLGNRNPQKAQHLLVRAFARGLDHDGVSLRIVGHVAPGHERYETLLAGTVAESGLGEGVVRLPPPDVTIAEVLSSFDVFALSSEPRSEGVPTVVLEAMACSVPVVALDTGGVGEVLLGDAGSVFAAGDVSGLAAELSSLERDLERRASLGAAGRRLVKTRFGLDQCLASHLRAYDAAARRV